MRGSLNSDGFWVEVRHRCPSPERYTWEIHCEDRCLAVEESSDRFRSWEEASQAGNKALKHFFAGGLIRSARWSIRFGSKPSRPRTDGSLASELTTPDQSPARSARTAHGDHRGCSVIGGVLHHEPVRDQGGGSEGLLRGVDSL